MGDFLAANPRLRRAAAYVAPVLGLLVVTQLLLPGGGGAGRGTPVAILFRGAVLGLVTSLTAAGLTLVYRTVRIINFSQTAIGVAGGLLVFELTQWTPVPFFVALLLGVGFAGLVGAVIGLGALRFSDAPRLVLTVLTIVLAGFLAGISSQVSNLPIFPNAERRGLETLLDPDALRAHLPLRGLSFHVGDLDLAFGFAEVLAIQVCLVVLLVIGGFLRYTRIGIAMRAISENAERASLLGIGVGGMSCLVWAIAGALGGAGVALTGVLTDPGVATGVAPDLLLPALAAAVIGRMRNLPATVVAAVGISVAGEAWFWSFRDAAAVFSVVLFLVVGIGLLIQRRTATRSEQSADVSSWQANREQRPIPPELLALAPVRFARRALVVLGLAGVALYPFMFGTGAVNLGGAIALNAIVVISLVVLTGWAGQVSLGQFGFVGLGAVIGGGLTSTVGIPFWFAVPLASALVALVAVVVGLPALRIHGLFLLVVTFAFSIAVQAVLFNERYFGWLLPDRVDRPTFLFLDFEDERSMYYLSVAALVAAIVVVTNLRRSRVGRILIATRDNENNVRAFGITAVRMRLLAFAVCGALSGFAGAIMAHQQRGITGESYGVARSIDVFVQAVFGGVGSVGGALLGSAYFSIVGYVGTSPLVEAFVASGGTLLLLYAAPGGLISVLAGARDAVLRIVAERAQLVVPSLLGDYDPDAVERRLYAHGEPLPNAGIALLPADVRYSIDSDLYGARRPRSDREDRAGPTAIASATGGSER